MWLPLGWLVLGIFSLFGGSYTNDHFLKAMGIGFVIIYYLADIRYEIMRNK